MRKIAFTLAAGMWLSVGAALAQLEGPAAGLETEMMEGVDVYLAEGGPPPGPPGGDGPGGPEVFQMPVPPPDGGDGEDGLMMAHRPGGGGFGGFGAGVPGGFPGANMTDEQLEKIYKAKEAFQEKVGPKMLELRSQSRALRDAMMEGELDTKRLQTIQNRINSLTGEIASLKLDQQVAILSTFTPEQRKEMRHAFLKRSVMGGGCGPGGWGRGCRKGGGGGGHCPGGPGGMGGMMKKQIMERKEAGDAK